MNVEYLLQLLGNRLTSLSTAKEQAFLTGDLERINTLDIETNGVLDTINKLKLLEGISQTALVTPFTEAEVVQNGIEASFGLDGQKVIFDGDAVGVLLGYDISSYATDPLHEEKIADILNYIGNMNNPADIDAYIDNEAIASPVTGAMLYNFAQKYNVDIRLMMALMELDSRFGTAGVAVNTLNPGNVGNNDSGETHTYSSWDEGVEAVAKWLDDHRVKKVEIINEEEILDSEVPTEKKENNPEEIVETKVETDKNGDTITTTTTTTTTEEVVTPVSESPVDTSIEIPATDIIQTETVSVVKQKRKRA
jgi:hypothetical protein